VILNVREVAVLWQLPASNCRKRWPSFDLFYTSDRFVALQAFRRQPRACLGRLGGNGTVWHPAILERSLK
jgi:hypothetical protein